MFFSQWRRWLNRIDRSSADRRRRARRPARRGYQPELEILEGRRLLATTLTVGPNVNLGHISGSQSEPTIAIDPTNPLHMFATTNNNNGSAWATCKRRRASSLGPGWKRAGSIDR